MRNINENVYYNQEIYDKPNTSKALSSGTFYGRVFLYFGISLLLTAVLTIGFSYLFNYLFPITNANNSTTYLILIIVSAIGIFITSLVCTFNSIKKAKGGIVSWIFYIVFMSFLLSSFSFYTEDVNLIGIAVLISSGLFLSMCIIGFISKGKMHWFAMLAIGLLISAGISSLVNIFLLPLINTSGAFYTNIYICEWIILIYSCIITIIDVKKIKMFAENTVDTTNLALYFALNLYNDYILILIKVIYILLINSRRN